MDLVRVRAALQGLNPYGGDNPHGNCSSCAVDAANALIGGMAPGHASIHGDTYVAGACPAPTGQIATFPLGVNGKYRVWAWLTFTAPHGVMVFEQEEDHVYVFVKHNGFYVIDANEQQYEELHGPADAIMTNAFDGFVNNYLDPAKDDDDFDEDLEVFYWGALHGNWH